MEKYLSINQSGCSVRCKLYCHDPARIKNVIIFGHGFAGHKDNGYAQLLAERIMKKHRDTALIVFNWPCHGDDARGRLCFDDCMAYLGLVIRYATERLKAEKLYACATSFGGYLFLRYLAGQEAPFERVVLRCPAVDMYDVLTGRIMSDADKIAIAKGKPILIGFDRKVRVTRDFLNELERSDITVNDYTALADRILILHGTRDEIVPYEVVERFADSNGISLVSFEGGDHRFTDPNKRDIAISRTIDFLQL